MFDRAEKSINIFCHNLFISNAIYECVQQLKKAQEEYELAVSLCDEKLAAQKQYEIKTCKSSLLLTAYVFDEVEDITT